MYKVVTALGVYKVPAYWPALRVLYLVVSTERICLVDSPQEPQPPVFWLHFSVHMLLGLIVHPFVVWMFGMAGAWPLEHQL